LRNNGNNNNVFIQASSEPGLLSSLGEKREWVCIFDSVSEASLECHWVWCERLTCAFDLRQRAGFLKWESVILHCWFSANGSFVKSMYRP